ncbi:MAG: type II toxin-antitoxin system HicA family toxin [Nitrosotalea sp.]
MSKLPRVSGNAIIKYLVNKKGFQISHQKGVMFHCVMIV